VPLICTRRRRRYTVDGIGAMLRRYCKKAGVASFGLQDMKAKGATDMYLAGVPLEKIKDAVRARVGDHDRDLHQAAHDHDRDPNRVAIGGK
jgi:hypothetical protein